MLAIFARRVWASSSFLRHYDEAQTLLKSQPLICAMGADAGQDYTSDGGTFPKGTEVAQFAYYRTNDSAAWATLHIGEVAKHIRVEHSFTGAGPELPQDYFPPALRAMRKASDAVRTDCHLDLRNMSLKAVGQDVDVLD